MKNLFTKEVFATAGVTALFVIIGGILVTKYVMPAIASKTASAPAAPAADTTKA